MYLSQHNTSLNTDRSLHLTIKVRRGIAVAHINSWENGLGFKLVKGQRYHFDFLDEEGTLLNRAHDNDHNLPIHEFVKSIPDKYKKVIIKQFSQQYSLLRMFRAIPAAYDLYLSNKLLLCLIIYRRISLFDAHKIIKSPQHIIVEFLYPGNKSALGYKSIVRLLKHRIIDDGKLKDVKRIDRFLTILVSGRLVCNNEKNILHIKYIPTYVFKSIFITHVFLLHKHLIFDPIQLVIDCTNVDFNNKELNKNKKRLMNLMADVKDIIYLARKIGIGENVIKERLYRAKNRYIFNQLHDEILMNSHIHDAKKLIPNISHIEPPIPGTENISPLRSYSEFINESDEMGHCLASAGYIDSVNDGQSYIYSVKTESDRCTLELGIKGNHILYINQLQSYKNSSPKVETQKLVDNWLKKHLTESQLM